MNALRRTVRDIRKKISLCVCSIRVLHTLHTLHTQHTRPTYTMTASTSDHITARLQILDGRHLVRIVRIENNQRVPDDPLWEQMSTVYRSNDAINSTKNDSSLHDAEHFYYTGSPVTYERLLRDIEFKNWRGGLYLAPVRRSTVGRDRDITGGDNAATDLDQALICKGLYEIKSSAAAARSPVPKKGDSRAWFATSLIPFLRGKLEGYLQDIGDDEDDAVASETSDPPGVVIDSRHLMFEETPDDPKWDRVVGLVSVIFDYPNPRCVHSSPEGCDTDSLYEVQTKPPPPEFILHGGVHNSVTGQYIVTKKHLISLVMAYASFVTNIGSDVYLQQQRCFQYPQAQVQVQNGDSNGDPNGEHDNDDAAAQTAATAGNVPRPHPQNASVGEKQAKLLFCPPPAYHRGYALTSDRLSLDQVCSIVRLITKEKGRDIDELVETIRSMQSRVKESSTLPSTEEKDTYSKLFQFVSSYVISASINCPEFCAMTSNGDTDTYNKLPGWERTVMPDTKGIIDDGSCPPRPYNIVRNSGSGAMFRICNVEGRDDEDPRSIPCSISKFATDKSKSNAIGNAIGNASGNASVNGAQGTTATTSEPHHFVFHNAVDNRFYTFMSCDSLTVVDLLSEFRPLTSVTQQQYNKNNLVSAALDSVHMQETNVEKILELIGILNTIVRLLCPAGEMVSDVAKNVDIGAVARAVDDASAYSRIADKYVEDEVDNDDQSIEQYKLTKAYVDVHRCSYREIPAQTAINNVYEYLLKRHSRPQSVNRGQISRDLVSLGVRKIRKAKGYVYGMYNEHPKDSVWASRQFQLGISDSCSKNPNMQLRSEPPNPRSDVSIWCQSTIEPALQAETGDSVL